MRRLEYNPLSGEFQFVNSETVVVDKTDPTVIVKIGFAEDRNQDLSTLHEYPCSTKHETVISDIDKGIASAYLMLVVPQGHELDYITSNGMMVPTENLKKENSCDVYSSILPINGGKMENISIKIN